MTTPQIGPGWRIFQCWNCCTAWKQACRDHLSYSKETCPDCGTENEPHDSAIDVMLKTDMFCNLLPGQDSPIKFISMRQNYHNGFVVFPYLVDALVLANTVRQGGYAVVFTPETETDHLSLSVYGAKCEPTVRRLAEKGIARGDRFGQPVPDAPPRSLRCLTPSSF